MIDLTLINSNINQVYILSIISVFKFLSWCTAVLVHSLSAPQAHASVQATLCRLQEHLREHLFIPHPHLTSSTTDSGVIAMSDRIGTEILSASHNHPTLNGLEYLDFPQDLDSEHMLRHVHPEYNYVDISHQQKVGGFYLFPRLALKALPPQFFSCIGL